MLSVLAFKRSLSAGILDGGTGEISLGGSRLNRFMKDVEKVTGQMGEGEAMPAEEAQAVQADASAEDAAPASDAMPTDAPQITPQPDVVAHSGAAPQPSPAEPWSALLQVGMQFLAALATPDDGNAANAASHPWIARDRQPARRCPERHGQRLAQGPGLNLAI